MVLQPEPEGPYVLGLDGGTEGVRVGLFDLAGRPVAFVREAYATNYSRPGWAEQDPKEWWSATARAIRRVLDAASTPPESIAGMALACTSYSMVCTDVDGIPLRPALIWMDVRSGQEARVVAATGDQVLRYSSSQASAEWMPSKALWLRNHEPDTYARAAWICDYVEWMGYRLTGERAASVNSAAIRCYYDRLLGGWPTGLFDAVGLSDLVDKLATRVLDMGAVVGGLDPAAAAELGLAADTPVAQGGADAFVGMIGLGVVSPGEVTLITGSSHLHLLQSEGPHYAPGLFGSYTDAVIPGQFTIEGGQSATGSAVNWFRHTLGSNVSLAELSRAAGDLQPGSDGVMALDYWQGNRTPHIDANARGMFWGLSLNHTPAHLFRALLESVCFGTEKVLQVMRGQGHVINEMVACGGALNSPTWMQIHADVSGIPIRTTEVPEAVTLGAAILAAVGAGLHSSMGEAVSAMVRTGAVVEPDLAVTEEYRPYFQLYSDSYEAMRPLMWRGTELADQTWSRRGSR